MKKGYLIATITVHDPVAFEAFKSASSAAIQEFGGRVLVRNPAPDLREGTRAGLVIVIEFESLAQAQLFYESDAYANARSLREPISDTDLVLVEGL